MNLRTFRYRHSLVVAMLLLTASHASAGTVIRFNSVLGSFDVRMYDAATPLTVANILNYVNDGDFDDSIVHRVENTFVQQANGMFVEEPFVIQGGNWVYPADGIFNGVITPIPSDPPVLNEPGLSNLRGTVALARSSAVNSGTNNWFVNLGDNSFLDNVNQGFTVFGRVVGDGMQVVDAIAELNTFNVRDSLNRSVGTKVPLHGDLSNGVTRDNFVLFTSVEELDIPDGDYNFDGTVNAADLAVWESDFGSTLKAEADGNGNGIVDAADFLLWQRNLGATSARCAVYPRTVNARFGCAGDIDCFVSTLNRHSSGLPSTSAT